MRRTAALAALASLLAGGAVRADVGVGYAPVDKDERGIWMQVEEEERKLETSAFVMRDAELNGYVRGVFCKVAGADECKQVRIYLIRAPMFNASMAPNGMMLVYSGLFLRMRDEAQLATVLAHEYAHYRKQHGLKLFRDVKGKTSAMALLSVIPVANLGAGLALAGLQYGIAGSLFSFSREMEGEADAASIEQIAKAGYDPLAASRIWQQIEAEREATAAARNRKKKGEGGFFASHPTSAERVAALKSAADRQAATGKALNRDEYRAALAPYWAGLIDDQIKLNDFGGTELLLAQLATEGWTGELLFARGELYRARGLPDDLPKAAEFYRAAIAAGNAPVEAYRGLGLALVRSGAREEGQAALRDYLGRSPQATDRAMIAMLAGG